METVLYIPSSPAEIPVPPQEPPPPTPAAPPVVHGPPAQAKTPRRFFPPACVIAVELLGCLALVLALRQVNSYWTARGQVQIVGRGVVSYPTVLPPDQFYFQPPEMLDVWITNGSHWTIKDIRLTWVHYAKSGTELTRHTRAFHDIIQPGRRGHFHPDHIGLPPQACKTKVSISDFDFVKPDTAAGTK
jgi:hypothetical protein